MKTILVPIERHTQIESTLRTACTLARAFDSYVEGFALTPGFSPFIAADTFSGAMISDTDLKTNEDNRQACRELFEDFLLAQDIPRNTAATPGLSFGWTTDRAGTGDGFVGSYGRVFDVVVVGRPGTAPAGPRMTTLEAALFETGRPILIAPPVAPDGVGDNIAIVWNGSTETARTVGLAMALLKRARRVTILTVEGAQASGPTGEEVRRHLLLNGVACDVHHISPGGQSRGAAVLAEAARLGSDLLIKGAYTQSRLRQMIFGGVTRHVITEATLPVFMAH